MIEGKKDFLTVNDFSREALMELIDLAIKMKKSKAGYKNALAGKKLGMIFTKSSTRTRVSFEAGIYELGGMGIFLNANDIQIGRGEPIADTAKVLSRYLDGIMIRTFSHTEVEELAENASIPVINGLTDYLHPCQVMADMMTVLEHKGRIGGLNFTYIGDGNNMAHSLGLLCSKLGVNFAIASPKGYEMETSIISAIHSNANISGSRILICADPREAIKDADVVYTDVWTSMGQERETEKRLKAFAGYQIDTKLAALAKPDYMFLHCLPAHRGEEVSADVIDGPNSAVWDEAENRLHAQKAIMHELMR
ncbi:MAG: ornithine carbamoyltransferase [Brevinematales bacterium]|nr:ornithine carbamoyltransferase [Brevinematales bacterium]